MPLRVLTLRTSWYTCIYSQVYIYHIADTFVDEPMLCKVTYVCPCECSHLEPLDVHACIHKYTYTLSQTFCIWTRVVQSHICVPLQVLKPRSSGQDMPGPWVATNLCHLTIYVHFFFICMYKHRLFFFVCVYVCLRVLNLRWDILVLVDFSKMFNLTLSILS